jgi:hypothetical protein
MTTAVSKLATPALVSVFDNEKRCCVGFVLARGRSGFETGVIPMNALVKIVPDPKQLIRGDRLKFVDGRWSDADDNPVPNKMLVLGKIRAMECWQNKRLVDCKVRREDGVPLPDIDELNGKVPESEWELDLSGKPRPPWQNVWGFYLCDPQSGSIYTFKNSTIGARIAYDKLNDRIETKQMLHGADIAPIVSLESRPMKTQWGSKLRPELNPIHWMGPNSNPAPALEHQAADAPALKPVPPTTASQELDDEIPF